MQALWKVEKGFLKDIIDALPEPKPHSNKKLAYQYYSKYLKSGKPKTKDEKRVYAYVKELMDGKR